MARKNSYFDGSVSLFSPSVIRGVTEGGSAIKNMTAATITSSIQSQTSSFRYDPIGSPIKSTQQIPVDWSKFENHTFFNSAEGKVNVAFEQIINNFPFDGTRGELLEFFDSLTGFEKWVYDQFPKSKGFLHFDGSSYITVSDKKGTYSPALSRDATGGSALSHGARPISFDFHLHIPTGINTSAQVILQRLSNDNDGITLMVDPTTSGDASGSMRMLVSSGTSYISASMDIQKGGFQHVCAVYDSSPSVNRIRLYKDSTLQSESPQKELGAFDYDNRDLTIGAGLTHTLGTDASGLVQVTFSQQLTAALDELRIYHNARPPAEQRAYMYSPVYPSRDLKLYFKFNEPRGNYDNNNILIDSSGNSLHTNITNYSEILREPQGLENPMVLEPLSDCPVLFPSYGDVINLNIKLLSSASLYDTNNPNLITKLIPEHYLLEASVFEGMGQDKLGDTSDPYGTSTNFPGGGKLGSPQIIASLLFVWAKFFDEVKMHLDQFGQLVNVDKIPEDNIADTFLPFLANRFGFELPPIFQATSLDQYNEGARTSSDPSVLSNSIKYIQAQIWRRILSDMNEIVRSKGTIHSIKALMRNMGINPDDNFRFREFGGSKTGRLSDKRETKTSILRALNFSASFNEPAGIPDTNGFVGNIPRLVSKGLLGPDVDLSIYPAGRTEPGRPLPGPTPGDNRNLLSGSWTFEGTYLITPDNELAEGDAQPDATSLVRFSTTGGGLPTSNNPSTFLNLLAYPSENQLSTGSIKLVFRDTWASDSFSTVVPKLELELGNVDIYDGEPWLVSFGRVRNDDIGSITSSSWFLRAGKQVGGSLSSYEVTSSYFDDGNYSVANFGYLTGSVLSQYDTEHNQSGSIMIIGSQSLPTGPANNGYTGLSITGLNANEEDRATFFGGKVLNTRFWSKALTEDEFKEHAKNPTSLGITDPRKNFNFNTSASGSWERLRVNYDFDQQEYVANSLGRYSVIDMTQNMISASFIGAEPNSRVITPVPVTYSSITPYFDQSIETNKIRVRSYLSDKNKELFDAAAAPLHSIPVDEEPIDDTRFSIEVSSVQALNEDITKILSTLDVFSEYIGRPELMYADSYPDLEKLRDIYFNRLTDKVNFKTFFEFFKWFDSSFGSMVEALIPRKTKFLGVNFVIEPHFLERPKVKYNTFDIYLGPNDRHGGKGTILLRQLVGDIRKF